MTDAPFPPGQNDTSERYANLRFVARSVAEMATKPRRAIYVMVALIAGLAWLWLVLTAAGLNAASAGSDLGPGAYHISQLISLTGIDPGQGGWLGWLIRLCTPQFSTISLSAFLISSAMWSAMSFAMMLPSAAPMLRTYADITDVARGQGKAVVSVAVLFAGYLAVWLLFAFTAALLQIGLVAFGAASDAITPLQGFVGGGLLLLAGLYQFSDLKNACLEKCRNPFSTFFCRWSDEPWTVFKLGIEQGFFCLGCCWALMLVMFVVGTMNLAWMAFFTLFAVLEKSTRGKVTSLVSGGILLAWGGILLSISLFGATAQ